MVEKRKANLAAPVRNSRGLPPNLSFERTHTLRVLPLNSRSVGRQESSVMRPSFFGEPGTYRATSTAVFSAAFVVFFRRKRREFR